MSHSYLIRNLISRVSVLKANNSMVSCQKGPTRHFGGIPSNSEKTLMAFYHHDLSRKIVGSSARLFHRLLANFGAIRAVQGNDSGLWETAGIPTALQQHNMGCWLQWCHNEWDGISNHQRFYCLLNCLLRRKSKKASKLHVTGPCNEWGFRVWCTGASHPSS